MTKRFVSFSCRGWIAACCFARVAAGQACIVLAPVAVSQAGAPTEVEARVAAQWLTANGAKANLAALDAYTSGNLVAGEQALASLQIDDRIKELFSDVGKTYYADKLVRAGVQQMAAANTDVDLFPEANNYIKKLYAQNAVTYKALSDANAEMQANSSDVQVPHLLRALSIVLGGIPQSPDGAFAVGDCAYSWLTQIQILRACYQRDPGKLLGYVTALFKAKSN